ncbi:hypothetical protein LWI28_005376 [Acer negundo]|uniref:Uncharacterized protein n=1 Tax=Acer negundo TaxID=4023 RepID=A0AAD5J459_ACENE|nr:hypothetical protein LWI28_005376 [Acer negundo]
MHSLPSQAMRPLSLTQSFTRFASYPPLHPFRFFKNFKLVPHFSKITQRPRFPSEIAPLPSPPSRPRSFTGTGPSPNRTISYGLSESCFRSLESTSTHISYLLKMLIRVSSLLNVICGGHIYPALLVVPALLLSPRIKQLFGRMEDIFSRLKSS